MYQYSTAHKEKGEPGLHTEYIAGMYRIEIRLKNLKINRAATGLIERKHCDTRR